jgi:hypothetical protein
MAISVTINIAEALNDLEAINKALLQPGAINEAMAFSVEALTIQHLTANYLPKDQNGLEFWSRVIKSVEVKFSDSEASVALTEIGIGLRYYGGEVTPGKGISSYTGVLTRALSIPTSKVGVEGGFYLRPGNAGLLAFIPKYPRGETVGWLFEGMQKTSTRGKRKGEQIVVPLPGGNLLYTLRTITRHKGDSKILPSEDEITRVAVEGAQKFLFGGQGE